MFEYDVEQYKTIKDSMTNAKSLLYPIAALNSDPQLQCSYFDQKKELPLQGLEEK